MTRPKKGFDNFTKSAGAKKFSDFSGRSVTPRPRPAAAPTVELPPPVSDTERDLARQLKDDSLAHDIHKMMVAHPYATAIEMLAMDWLDKNLADYVYQAQVNGGFRPGGNVPDFVVSAPGQEWTALLINGNYWHRFPEKNAADKLQITGSYYEGRTIARTVIVWESNMMSRSGRDSSMNDAMQGIEQEP
jgi:hypothetical protein